MNNKLRLITNDQPVDLYYRRDKIIRKIGRRLGNEIHSYDYFHKVLDKTEDEVPRARKLTKRQKELLILRHRLLNSNSGIPWNRDRFTVVGGRGFNLIDIMEYKRAQ